MSPFNAQESDMSSPTRPSPSFADAAFDQLILDPARYFEAPRAVLDAPGLDTEHKLALLRRWEADARQLQAAEEENMTGGEPSRLGQVLEAIEALEGKPRA
jgi:hypothetical protein